MTGGLLGAGYRVATSGAAERQGIVHRLDANTTGLMVVAKSESAYSALKQAFRERTVSKTYHALIQGHPDPLRGTIDGPIGRRPSGDGRFAVVADGRPSVTHYDTLEAFRAATLVTVGLETGRTHQIRVHITPHPPPLLRRPALRGGPDAGRPPRPDPAVAARGPAPRSSTRRPAARSSSSRPYAPDLPARARRSGGRKLTSSGGPGAVARHPAAGTMCGVEISAYIDALDRDGALLADAADRGRPAGRRRRLSRLAGPRGLVRHQAYVHDWAARHVRDRPPELIDDG